LILFNIIIEKEKIIENTITDNFIELQSVINLNTKRNSHENKLASILFTEDIVARLSDGIK
jgi:hypothetical protein